MFHNVLSSRQMKKIFLELCTRCEVLFSPLKPFLKCHLSSVAREEQGEWWSNIDNMMSFLLKIFHAAQADKNKFPLWKVVQCWHCFASVYSFESWQLRNLVMRLEGERENSYCSCRVKSRLPAMINITRHTQTTACTTVPSAVQSWLWFIWKKK